MHQLVYQKPQHYMLKPCYKFSIFEQDIFAFSNYSDTHLIKIIFTFFCHESSTV